MPPRSRPDAAREKRRSSNASVNPVDDTPQNQKPIQRAPHQYDHKKDIARPFVCAKDALEGIQPNEDAPVLPFELCKDLPGIPQSSIDQNLSSNQDDQQPKQQQRYQYLSLDQVIQISGFSDLFATDADFRQRLRDAIRRDIFDTTPSYANLPEKAQRMLLLPDSSLQGQWNTQLMPRLDEVLKEHSAVTGDLTGADFMKRIGALCGETPSFRWIDDVGISQRRVAHAWRQETGRSSFTVMLGFPAENDYEGLGVFSHICKLPCPFLVPVGHPEDQPLLCTSPVPIPEEYIVRPQFTKGQEILVYRDTDVLISAPDVTYRASVMWFM